MVQQFMHAAALREQDFTAEKEVLIAKAKTEAMSQLVRTGGNTGDGVWQDQFAENHQMNLNNSEYMHHPLFSSASYHVNDFKCIRFNTSTWCSNIFYCFIRLGSRTRLLLVFNQCLHFVVLESCQI